MPTYIAGSELPAELQAEALATYVSRYTRDHTPDWMGKGHRNGLPPLHFDSDAEWLAHTMFPCVGEGDAMRLSRGQHRPVTRPTYPDNPERRGPQPVKRPAGYLEPDLAQDLALALAMGSGLPVWVKIDGAGVGDMQFRPPNGIGLIWRKATPQGELQAVA